MFDGTKEARKIDELLEGVLEKYPMTEDNVSEWVMFVNYILMSIEEIEERIYAIHLEQRRARNGK